MSEHRAAQVPTMSTAVLKAMSHPVRRRILSTVGEAGSGRAADLAERLGEPANRLSFHLRVLAVAGMIEEAPELARDKRDRVWKLAGGPRSLGSPERPISDPVLGQAVLTGILADHRDLLARVAAWAPKYTTGEDPVVRGELTDHTLRLSREQFTELTGRITDLVDEYREKAKAASVEDELLGWRILVAGASEEI
ncbi:MAG: winged helix-turn-helix domain-containing protein [Galactobacter sp.]